MLVVAPLSDTPWCRAEELARALRSLGHDALVASAQPQGDAIPFPVPAPIAVPHGRHPIPPIRLAGLRLVAWIRWIRAVRMLLRQTTATLVLAWDPFFLLGLRVARRRGTRIAWVAPELVPTGRTERIQRAVAAFVADTVVVPTSDATTINLARHVEAPPLAPTARSAAAGDGWIVLHSGSTNADLHLRLAERARRTPAAAVVVDARQPVLDHEDARALAYACRAEVVHLDHDDSFLHRFTARDVVDPGLLVSRLDHRHRAAIAAGRRLLVPEDAVLGPWSAGATVAPADAGWIHVSPRLLLSDGPAEWASRAITDPLHPRAAFVERVGEPLLTCPGCGGGGRRELRRVGSTHVFECASCGLWYGSPKVPDHHVYDAGYHDGTGAFGTDYVNATWYCERLSDARLDTLTNAGVAPGSLVDIGTGLGHFVARARAAGWTADGLEPVDAAVTAGRELYGLELLKGDLHGFRPAERYAVVTLGQTLEHFSDARSALAHIRDHVLAPGGHLLVEVPNAGGLPRRLRRDRWSHWQSGDHVSYFTPATLHALLESCGYEVRHSETTSGVFPGLGAVGTLYGLGILDPASAWFSAGRSAKRLLAARGGRRRVTSGIATAFAGSGHAGRGRGEQAALWAAAIVDRAGFGDHVRVVARLR